MLHSMVPGLAGWILTDGLRGYARSTPGMPFKGLHIKEQTWHLQNQREYLPASVRSI